MPILTDRAASLNKPDPFQLGGGSDHTLHAQFRNRNLLFGDGMRNCTIYRKSRCDFASITTISIDRISRLPKSEWASFAL
ncbi:MAG TPA: hypothetical protein VFY06_02695 [Verrucomicrobiae bacterium]|nr:hypothetical protein [Verrucomicrobiae bacterium]